MEKSIKELEDTFKANKKDGDGFLAKIEKNKNAPDITQATLDECEVVVKTYKLQRVLIGILIDGFKDTSLDETKFTPQDFESLEKEVNGFIGLVLNMKSKALILESAHVVDETNKIVMKGDIPGTVGAIERQNSLLESWYNNRIAQTAFEDTHGTYPLQAEPHHSQTVHGKDAKKAEENVLNLALGSAKAAEKLMEVRDYTND